MITMCFKFAYCYNLVLCYTYCAPNRSTHITVIKCILITLWNCDVTYQLKVAKTVIKLI